MIVINLEVALQTDAKKLFDVAKDFGRIKDLFPAQFQKIDVISKNGNQITTKEELTFQTLVKSTIRQKTIHTIQYPNITSHIVDGPFKNSIISADFNQNNSGTIIKFNAQLSVSLKFKIFEPIIKSKYKAILLSSAYKINNLAME
tara:strand:- start:1370 stop:1804 length:435 start_codon:yes stop_codon:yes gene_type:complete